VVSVIIPTFERRELVQRAVAGVLAQSYRDFELIVVDDGSTDGTAEALAPLGDALRVLRQENHGTAAARNAGLAVARGEIVAFLDSDDRWLEDHLEAVVGILDRHPAAVLAGTSPGFLAAGRDEPGRARLVHALPRLLIANDVGYVSSVAVRRSALARVGGFGEGLEPAEYTDFVMRLALEGPFALLRRRTVVPQATTGSLLDRGRASGRYLEVLVGIAHRTAAATRGLPVGERAAGAARFFDALGALNAGRKEDAREALREACSRFPELSREPVLVGRQLLNAMPGGRLAVFSTVAGLWPEPRSDTAVALRGYAVAFALRAGRPREAGRQLRSLRPRDARLVLTRRRELAGVARRSVAGLAHRGRESSLLTR
jgi:hypothetical protein